MRLHGRATLLEPDEAPAAAERLVAIAALRERYPQYRSHDLESRPIIAIDVNPRRRATAIAFGATDVVIAAPDDDLVVAVRDITGRGVDHAFECAGLVPTVEAAIAMTAPGGSAVLIGMPPRGARVSFDVSEIFRGRRIVGSLNGACDPARDFPAMIDHVRNGRLDIDPLVTQVFAFTEWRTAIATTRSGAVVRSVLDLTV